MRDINLSSRDLYGNITFGLNSINNINITNFDILLQKIEILTLSNTKQTYFGIISGGDANSLGKFNFNSSGYDDFKAIFISNLLAIKQSIQQDELANNIPIDDRIKNLSLQDIIFDSKTFNISLSLNVSTNNSSKIIKLPVK